MRTPRFRKSRSSALFKEHARELVKNRITNTRTIRFRIASEATIMWQLEAIGPITATDILW